MDNYINLFVYIELSLDSIQLLIEPTVLTIKIIIIIIEIIIIEFCQE